MAAPSGACGYSDDEHDEEALKSTRHARAVVQTVDAA
jgi:hypothetical protein